MKIPRKVINGAICETGNLRFRAFGAPHVERGQSPPPRPGGRNAKSEGPASCGALRSYRWPSFLNWGSKMWTHINIEAGNDIVVYPRFRPSPDLWYHWHFPWPGIPSQSCACHHGFQAPEVYRLWLSGIHRGSGLRSLLDRRSQVPRFFSNPVLVPIPVLLSDGHPISDGGISHPMKPIEKHGET